MTRAYSERKPRCTLGHADSVQPDRPARNDLPAAVKHNRVFEKNAETLGGASLDRDNGVNVGVSYSLTYYIDFGASYSRVCITALIPFLLA
jgi:hypothetical protein